jgi:hypothetical protein
VADGCACKGRNCDFFWGGGASLKAVLMLLHGRRHSTSSRRGSQVPDKSTGDSAPRKRSRTWKNRAAELSKAWVCGRSFVGIVDSNPAEDINVVSVVCCQVEVSASD